MRTLFTLTVALAAACLLQTPAYAQYKTRIGGGSSSSSSIQQDINKRTKAANAGDANAQFLLGSIYSGYMDNPPVPPPIPS